MVNCRNCAHCVKAAVIEWIDDDDIYHRVWQYECPVCGWIDEHDAIKGACPSYIHVVNDE